MTVVAGIALLVLSVPLIEGQSYSWAFLGYAALVGGCVLVGSAL